MSEESDVEGNALQTLLNQRANIKGRMTRIENFMKAVNEETNSREVKVRLDQLDALFIKFEKIQFAIEDADSGPSRANLHEAERSTMEDRYYTLKASMDEHLHPTANDLTNLDGSRSERSSKPRIKLPKLDLPTFDGNIKEWTTFKNLFYSVIDESDLPVLQKFQYLKSSCTGEAAGLISSLLITEDNYKKALSILNARYENKLILVNAHLKSFMNHCTISKSNLKEFLVCLQQSLDSLKAMEIKVDEWDIILIYIITQKLDNSLRASWEINRKDHSLPTLKELLEFLNLRMTAFELINDSRMLPTNQSFSKTSNKVILTTSVEKHLHCIMCKGNHYLYKCPTFLELQPDKRNLFVKNNALCFNCLNRYNHKHKCTKLRCFTCQGKHHTSIHVPNFNSAMVPSPSKAVNYMANSLPSANLSADIQTNASQLPTDVSQVIPSTVLVTNTNTSQILLSTAIIHVQDAAGQWRTARALLDSASEVNLVSRKLAVQLKCDLLPNKLIIQGVGNSNNVSQVSLTTNISSRLSEFNSRLTFLVMDKITVPLPHSYINTFNWSIPPTQANSLADPNFFIPNDIDLLIGAQLFYTIIKVGHIQLGPNLPHLIDSEFGWIVSGSVILDQHSLQKGHVSMHTTITNYNEDLSLNKLLTKFWEQEELQPISSLSPEHQYCEEIYTNTTTRDKDGRYTVDLPLVPNQIQNLGESFNTAYRCLLMLESKFQKDPTLYIQYKEFIQEFITLGHAKYVSKFNICSQPTYYLPHHAVLKPDSQTTKLRTVFNGSAVTSTGLSLNDILYEGPNIYNNILNIMLRFRFFKFVISTDIVKMYRQIRVNPKHCSLQRILWRSSCNEPLQCIELTTVVYGNKSAPYLACRTLFHLADTHIEDYPIAAQRLKTDSYVDDILTGANSIEEVKELCSELINLLSKGCFQLHKWSANDPLILQHISQLALDNNSTSDSIFTPKIVKTLGLKWTPDTDILQICVPEITENTSITKRYILSYISRIYDPLGMIAPTTITAKILLQLIWKEKVDWDSIDISENLKLIWIKFSKNLKYLQQIKIPRYQFSDIPIEIMLIGFCDASLQAYGACLYFRATYHNKKPSCTLIMSKTRVSPLKPVTIPRLELCGALLLANLVQRIKVALSNHYDINNIYLFTDSSIVLHWLKSPFKKWDSYVSNRLIQIVDITPYELWHYINTKENPADLLTRGISSNELLSSSLWWQGPYWVYEEPYNWPISNPTSNTENNLNIELSSAKSNLVLTTTIDYFNFNELFMKFSNFTKLTRVIAYIQRFIHNLKYKTRLEGPLSVSEVTKAHNFIILKVQCMSFPKELHELNSSKTNSTVNNNLLTFKSSPLRKLNPFVDRQGILRVGGRIRHANIPYSQAHPIILPQKHYITTLIVRQYHLRLLHSGTQNTLCNIRLKYWPINGRAEVKRVIHDCVRCVRYRAAACEQQMADLPSPRVTSARPFTHVGVDFSGAISIRSNMFRNCKYTKGYICLFICLATKALHLELVSDLTASGFINALKRFIGRRGICSTLYSDNATNFKGAHNELTELYKLFKNDKSYSEIVNFNCIHNIHWKFTVPLASHMGGVYEAGIKSVKSLLKRHLCNTKLTYELLSTVLIQIEGILNSRPLCSLTDELNDLSCLTPAHFLIGSSLVELPEPNVSHIPENRLSIFQRISSIKQLFWKQWYKQYLSELQPRQKWLRVHNNVKEGDLVIIKEESTPPSCWLLGRIIKIFTNKTDNLVRSVLIKTCNGDYHRPITKIIVLPTQKEFIT